MPAMRRHELLQDFAAHRLLHPAAPGLIIPQQQSGRTELADSGIALLRRALADGVEQPARDVVLADRRDLQQLHRGAAEVADRSEEHTSELQSLMRTSYAVFCLNKNSIQPNITTQTEHIPQTIAKT